MKPEEVAKLYQGRIRNLDESRSCKGLGLHIIERLCSQFGWRLSLQSNGRTTTAQLNMDTIV